MKVLIFHGYLLRGTGSNIYNVNLIRALAALGHEVHILCQDRDADAVEGVDGQGSISAGKVMPPESADRSGPGSVTAWLPDIAGLLPVFVADHYEGFESKTFPELSEAELDRYLQLNVAAARALAEHVGGFEAGLANHLVVGPVILARAGLGRDAGGPGFAIKVHGSDLSYTVRPHPDRFVPFAREGVGAASALLVGSRHTAEDLWGTLEDPGLAARTRLGPPGVDVKRFKPRPREQAIEWTLGLAAQLDTGERDTSFGRDTDRAARVLRWYTQSPGPKALYVGKLLINKGVDLLLAAWPLVHREHPDADLLLVGFGGFLHAARELIGAFADKDEETALLIARRGRALEGGEPEPLKILLEFFESAPPQYWEDARSAAHGGISLSGRLEHDEVAELLPLADALVMPSTFPEAFGMVTAEAAAAGVLPISAAHSGMLEVSARLGEGLEPEVARLLSFPIGPGTVEAIAERLNAWFAEPEARRREVMSGLSKRAGELWGWERVARDVLSASAGQIDDLAPAGDPA